MQRDSTRDGWRTYWPGIGRSRTWRQLVPFVLVAGSVLQFGSLVWIYAVFDGVDQLLTSTHLAAYLIGLTLAGVVAACGILLRRGSISTDRYGRAFLWWIGGATFFLAINLPVMAVTPELTLEEAVNWGHYMLAIGSASGAVVGVSEARAIERTRAAAAAKVQARIAEQETQRLDYLNSLLRHEILNTATVIDGYSDLALEEADGSIAEYLETIRRHSEKLTEVIRDVRVLITAAQDKESFEPTNLTAVLHEELADLESRHESVEVRTAIEEDVQVLADDLLPRVFGNLLSNAVEHNDSKPPRIRVTADQSAETVTVRIEDNGPGIPETEQATLFERGESGDHGFGLYLVSVLVERYGGDISLSETGPAGTTFTVTLPSVGGAVDPPQTVTQTWPAPEDVRSVT